MSNSNPRRRSPVFTFTASAPWMRYRVSPARVEARSVGRWPSRARTRRAVFVVALVAALQARCAYPGADRLPTSAAVGPFNGFRPALRERASRLGHPLLPRLRIDSSDGLSPDELALISVVANPDLRVLRDARGLAHAQVIEAGLLPNPTVSFSVDVPAGPQPPGTSPGYGVTLGWSLGELVRRGASRRAARLAERSVVLDVAWAEWRVALGAQLGAYRLIVLREVLAAHQRYVRELTKAVGQVRRATAARALPVTQLVSTEAALRKAEADLTSARRRLDLQRVQLGSVVGLGPDVGRKVRGSLPCIPHETSLTSTRLLRGLDGRRLDLRALKVALRGQSAALRAAALRAFPGIWLGVGFSQDTGNVKSVGLSIEVELPVFDRGQAQRASVRASRKQIRHRYEVRLNETRRRVLLALATLRGVRARLAVLGRAIASQARLVETYRQEVQAGRADILLYHTARSTLLDLRLQSLEERLQGLDALVDLRLQTGRFALSASGSAARTCSPALRVPARRRAPARAARPSPPTGPARAPASKGGTP